MPITIWFSSEPALENGPPASARSLSRVIPRGLSFGKKERKMGLGGSVTSEMIFRNVRVPKENLLLREGEGWTILSRHANLMRVWGAASHGLGNRRRSL